MGVKIPYWFSFNIQSVGNRFVYTSNGSRVMQEQSSFYPVKLISRSVTRKRARRVSWFVLGTAFGVSCAMTASTSMNPTAWIAQLAAQKFITAQVTNDKGDINIIGSGVPARAVEVTALAIGNAESHKNQHASKGTPTTPVTLSTDSAD